MFKGICKMQLHTRNIDKARAFYAMVLGWSGKPAEGDFFRVETESGTPATMEQTQHHDEPSRWMPCIEVEDVRATLRHASQAGAQHAEFVLLGNHEIGYIVDPTGAEFCVEAPVNRVTAEKRARRPRGAKARR